MPQKKLKLMEKIVVFFLRGGGLEDFLVIEISFLLNFFLLPNSPITSMYIQPVTIQIFL